MWCTRVAAPTTLTIYLCSVRLDQTILLTVGGIDVGGGRVLVVTGRDCLIGKGVVDE